MLDQKMSSISWGCRLYHFTPPNSASLLRYFLCRFTNWVNRELFAQNSSQYAAGSTTMPGELKTFKKLSTLRREKPPLPTFENPSSATSIRLSHGAPI